MTNCQKDQFSGHYTKINLYHNKKQDIDTTVTFKVRMDNCHNYVTISISLESIYNSFSFNSQFSDSKTGIFLGFRGKLLQRLLISCLFTTVFHLTLHFMTVETASFNSLTTKYQFLSIWYTFPLKNVVPGTNQYWALSIGSIVNCSQNLHINTIQ